MKAEIQKGTNPFAVASIVDLPKYKDIPQYEVFFPLNVWFIAINEVLGPLNWRPANTQCDCDRSSRYQSPPPVSQLLGFPSWSSFKAEGN